MPPLAGSASPFDLAFGLPLHPLAVHVPVVLLPLGAIGVVLMLLVPRWRTVLAWPVIAVLAIATGGALVAKLSGEALAARVGPPGQHEQLGNWVLVMAVILCSSTLGWWLWQRRLARRRRSNGVIGLIAGTVLGTLALGSIIVAVLTGHTGATAVWQERIAPAAAPTTSAEPTSPQPTSPESPAGEPATPSPSPEGADAGDTGIGLAEVAQHDDSASCWVAIEGTVYDVTAWIPQHPGGPDRILGICGTNATEAFSAQHEGAAMPAEQLSRFAIGSLDEG
ncbi:cytochrome b5-like heme/steroid binding domain-containing protein [Agrococcus baldri]|uniref:Cytochrome b5 heme-binding domain-containing protein n=1 Tax=Agrococcus baldri TaxID=153730 RepID=A0AA87UR98_9MICO|nr:cytochrome b5-like heme/steroid binding domain-containing protein [Agrococcus baldri]GEK79498.1 hypothetical protein ABA31_08490 [Agrococcus baldri]